MVSSSFGLQRSVGITSGRWTDEDSFWVDLIEYRFAFAFIFACFLFFDMLHEVSEVAIVVFMIYFFY